MKFCASCQEARSPTQIVKTSEKQLPEWLSQIDYVSQFIEGVTSFKKRTPPRANLRVPVSLGKQHRGKALLFWAAEPSRNPRTIVVPAVPMAISAITALQRSMRVEKRRLNYSVPSLIRRFRMEGSASTLTTATFIFVYPMRKRQSGEVWFIRR